LISTGMTIRPSSSTLRTTPPARADAALPRTPAECLITLIVTLAISLGWSPALSIDAFLPICQGQARYAVFPYNSHLLRQLRPAPRACLHDGCGGRPRAASPPARRGRLLPDGDR